MFDHFKNFVAMVRNVFRSTTMVLQNDNATEYVNQYFPHFVMSWALNTGILALILLTFDIDVQGPSMSDYVNRMWT